MSTFLWSGNVARRSLYEVAQRPKLAYEVWSGYCLSCYGFDKYAKLQDSRNHRWIGGLRSNLSEIYGVSTAGNQNEDWEKLRSRQASNITHFGRNQCIWLHDRNLPCRSFPPRHSDWIPSETRPGPAWSSFLAHILIGPHCESIIWRCGGIRADWSARLDQIIPFSQGSRASIDSTLQARQFLIAQPKLPCPWSDHIYFKMCRLSLYRLGRSVRKTSEKFAECHILPCWPHWTRRALAIDPGIYSRPDLNWQYRFFGVHVRPKCRIPWVWWSVEDSYGKSQIQRRAQCRHSHSLMEMYQTLPGYLPRWHGDDRLDLSIPNEAKFNNITGGTNQKTKKTILLHSFLVRIAFFGEGKVCSCSLIASCHLTLFLPTIRTAIDRTCHSKPASVFAILQRVFLSKGWLAVMEWQYDGSYAMRVNLGSKDFLLGCKYSRHALSFHRTIQLTLSYHSLFAPQSTEPTTTDWLIDWLASLSPLFDKQFFFRKGEYLLWAGQYCGNNAMQATPWEQYYGSRTIRAIDG